MWSATNYKSKVRPLRVTTGVLVSELEVIMSQLSFYVVSANRQIRGKASSLFKQRLDSKLFDLPSKASLRLASISSICVTIAVTDWKNFASAARDVLKINFEDWSRCGSSS